MAVINELGGEKIDIIEYSDAPEKYLANSLSPAKAVDVKIMPRNKAVVAVPEDQLSLAIGKDGQNVRLAAKLTGWKIDVKAEGQEIGEEKEAPEVEGLTENKEESSSAEIAEDKPKKKKTKKSEK